MGIAAPLDDSVRTQALWGYQIGGGDSSNSGLPSRPTQYDSFASLSLGVEWETNMSCGSFDPQVTLKNQLNGATDGFTDMMDNIITSAKSAVAGLPALLIQRANPGLYDLLQQGVLQGKLDFEAAQTSCESIQSFLIGESDLPWESASTGTRQQSLANAAAASGGDAVGAKQIFDEGEKDMLNAGLDWTCGNKRGGTGQQPIETVYDVVVAGYNIMHQRTDLCNNGSPTTAQATGSQLTPYWSSADLAAKWVRGVVGETKLSVCDSCRKISTEPGTSLENKIAILSESLNDQITNIVTGASSLTAGNLVNASAPPAISLQPPHIYELREIDSATRALVIADLADEIAYARVHEQTRLAVRMLRTGSMEPNVQAFTGANDVIEKAIDTLEENNRWIVQATQETKRLSSITADKLLIFAEKRVREAVPVFRTPNRDGYNEMGFN